ncbi:nucleotidyltransferase substrate binding protein [Anaerovorax odorimutans]|uniref:nucleotidyltransferase substrate binding protein n=1 Tax=Anaerovorax odorimutans TaxID=109327 RepID=UPI0003FA1724|nr:nucleotidyltransferase substrate binding protein [Anaerovorax odorimutans]
MKNFEFKYSNLKKTYEKLEEACNLYDGKDALIRDSLIQRFELNYEFCYKTLQEYMKYMGVFLDDTFPRAIFKKAYANNLISREDVWIRLIQDRNMTSHIYNEKLADEIANRVVTEYLPAIKELIKNIDESIDKFD